MGKVIWTLNKFPSQNEDIFCLTNPSTLNVLAVKEIKQTSWSLQYPHFIDQTVFNPSTQNLPC